MSFGDLLKKAGKSAFGAVKDYGDEAKACYREGLEMSSYELLRKVESARYGKPSEYQGYLKAARERGLV